MNCLYCGKKIKSNRGRQKYCSKACRLQHYHEMQKELNKRVCVICGKQLSGRNRKTCKGECRVIYAQKRRTEHKSVYLPKDDVYAEKMKRTRPEINLEYIARECKKEGITYGEYCVKHKLYEKGADR